MVQLDPPSLSLPHKGGGTGGERPLNTTAAMVASHSKRMTLVLGCIGSGEGERHSVPSPLVGEGQGGGLSA